MKYLYDFARLPQNPELLHKINCAAIRLERKFAALDASNEKLSELHTRVVKDKQSNLMSNLQAFSFVAAWALHKSGLPLSKTCLLECGGGIGMLSLLAKELGIAKVVYNDIYDVACNDAKKIAVRLGLAADYYVEGDIDQLHSFCQKNSLSFNAIVSFDVIEHIYDIEDYLVKMGRFSGKPIGIAMASYANKYNPRYSKKIKTFQRICEHKGREAFYGRYERDNLRPYIDIRTEIISDSTAQLTRNEIKELATRTRGMRQDDIIKAVQVYLNRRVLPAPPLHPTNTCDPYTGNWQEHLMNPSTLVTALKKGGFDAGWLSGYYACSGSLIERLIKKTVNATVRVLNKTAVSLVPFYVLYGSRD